MKSTSRTAKRTITVFNSFAEENRAECRRMARMTPKQRFDEFVIIQERLWGDKWTKEPMKKIAWYEKVKW
jgi:hypothetical protein